MKRTFIAAGLAVVLSAYGSPGKSANTTGNPFLTEFATPFGVPPFDKITLADYNNYRRTPSASIPSPNISERQAGAWPLSRCTKRIYTTGC